MWFSRHKALNNLQKIKPQQKRNKAQNFEDDNSKANTSRLKQKAAKWKGFQTLERGNIIPGKVLTFPESFLLKRQNKALCTSTHQLLPSPAGYPEGLLTPKWQKLVSGGAHVNTRILRKEDITMDIACLFFLLKNPFKKYTTIQKSPPMPQRRPPGVLARSDFSGWWNKDF